MTKTISITDFLTKMEIKKAMKLEKANDIEREIIAPNIERINRDIGQENDSKYLAYLVEYVVTESKKEEARKTRGPHDASRPL